MAPTRSQLTLITLLMLLSASSRAVDKKAASLHQQGSTLSLAPVPEFAAVARVLLSEDLIHNGYGAANLMKEIRQAGAQIDVLVANDKAEPQLATHLKDSGLTPEDLRSTSQLVVSHANVWIRDYGPVIARRRSSDPKVADELVFVDFGYESSIKTGDQFPSALAKHLGAQVSSATIALDGGNFLTNGQLCIAGIPKEPTPVHRLAAAAPSTRAAALRESFTRLLGCQETILIEDPPHEHIDMWAKIIDADTVFVNELDDASLDVVRSIYGYVPEPYIELAAKLDAATKQLARHLKVVRLPMPLPYRGSFRTFTNALLVNKTAIVPSYRRFGWNYDDYPDQGMEVYYERKVEAAYESYGFQVRFVQADGLIYNGGALHCVALQIPRLQTNAKTALGPNVKGSERGGTL